MFHACVYVPEPPHGQHKKFWFLSNTLDHFSSSLTKKENFIPRSICVDKEVDLVIGSDFPNWEDNFAVVDDS